MTHIDSLKNLPAPLQLVVRPMLLLSLGLHGLLLFMPLGSKPKPTPAAKPESVKITQLAASSKPAAKPSPKLSSKVNRRAVLPPRQPAVTLPPRQAIVAPVPSPVRPAPTPAADEKPAAAVKDPLADFPRYPNAQPGSLDLFEGVIDQASQYTKDGLEQVAAYFEAQLPVKGYAAEDLNSDKPNLKVYQVTKDSKLQFLHLIFQPEKGTVIVVAPQQLTLDNLENSEVEVLSPEKSLFDDTLVEFDSQVGLGINTETEIAEFGSEAVDALRGKALSKTPDQVSPAFQKSLEAAGFAVSAAGDYQGGPLYQVTQGAFTHYLSFIPAKDGQGTLIVTWKKSPI